MPGTAFLYPGQGSQSPGMAKALLAARPDSGRLFDAASEAVGWDVRRACTEAGEEELARTDVAQVAILVTSAAMSSIARDAGMHPDAVAGHSLGEYTAMVAASVLSLPAACELVSTRSRLMQEAAGRRPGGMAAVIGLDGEALAAALAGIADPADGPFIANLNCPGQTVISGTLAALAKAGEPLKAAGAKRLIPLKVAGAFHSPLMGEASEEFNAIIDGLELHEPAVPMVSNYTGAFSRTAEEIRAALRRQMTGPVRWMETVATLRASGIDDLIELGPGRVLSGLLKRCGLGPESIRHFEDLGKA